MHFSGRAVCVIRYEKNASGGVVNQEDMWYSLLCNVGYICRKVYLPRLPHHRGRAVCIDGGDESQKSNVKRGEPAVRPAAGARAAGRGQGRQGKPRETVGRKATGLRRGRARYVRRAAFWQTIGNNGTQSSGGCGIGGQSREPSGAMPVRLRLSKPWETVGRKVMGPNG